MLISYPCIITARLLPGIKVNDTFISIEYDGTTKDNRDRYRYYIDGPNFEHSDKDISSGVGGGSLKDGLHSLLSFLGACGESVNYRNRTGKIGDNSDLFPTNVGEWCSENEDDLSMAQMEIEENPDCIKE